MTERAGKNTLIKISGVATIMTAEATTLITTGLVYQITNAVKQVLDIATVPTVLVGGSAVSAATYTVNYLNGKITFLSSATRTVTVTGKYLPMTTAAYANQMSNSRACDMHEATAFQATHKSRIAGLKSASGTLAQFDVTDTTYSDALAAGLPVVMEIRTGLADEPDRFWALLESTEVQAAIDSIQSETISWVSKDAWLRLGV